MLGGDLLPVLGAHYPHNSVRAPAHPPTALVHDHRKRWRCGLLRLAGRMGRRRVGRADIVRRSALVRRLQLLRRKDGPHRWHDAAVRVLAI